MSLNLKHIRWLKAIDLVLALFDVKYGRTPLRNLIAATQRLSGVLFQYLPVDVATRVVAGRRRSTGTTMSRRAMGFSAVSILFPLDPGDRRTQHRRRP